MQAKQSHVQIHHLIIQKLCFVNVIIIRCKNPLAQRKRIILLEHRVTACASASNSHSISSPDCIASLVTIYGEPSSVVLSSALVYACVRTCVSLFATAVQMWPQWTVLPRFFPQQRPIKQRCLAADRQPHFHKHEEQFKTRAGARGLRWFKPAPPARPELPALLFKLVPYYVWLFRKHLQTY